MPRPKRLTVHSAAVLVVLSQDGGGMWTASEVAEATTLSYGVAYSVLQRLWRCGQVARVTIDEQRGRAYLHYELTELGAAHAELVRRHLPDPVRALTAWIIEEDEELVAYGHKQAPRR